MNKETTQGRRYDSSSGVTNNKDEHSMCLHIKVQNMQQYLEEQFEREQAAFRSSGGIQTGFINLDLHGNLYPGLYVLGAISSLGKTTFVHQMCDQLAQSGEYVIYFSIEQTRLELVSKSLAREIAQVDGVDGAVSSLQIREGELDDRTRQAMERYATYADHIEIAECSFNTIINDILLYVKWYIAQYKRRPIIVIDYLQAIQASDSHISAKDAVDRHVRALKELQSEYNLIVIIISALNRANYMSAIDFESYKESGGIEYTADVVWGLQLEVIHEKAFEQAGQISAKRQLVQTAKAASPRRIELVCLKNRFGQSNYACHFDYYSKVDLFKPRFTEEEQMILFRESQSSESDEMLPF